MTMESGTSVSESRWVEGHGGNPPGQGPFLKVMLRVSEGAVDEAKYETYQCPACHDCGKAICELVKAKTLEEAGRVNWEAMVARVGVLPRDKRHCMTLALLALDEALKALKSEENGD